MAHEDVIKFLVLQYKHKRINLEYLNELVERNALTLAERDYIIKEAENATL